MYQDTHNLQKIYQSAINLHENGELHQAIELYSKILDLFPDADLVLCNHGLACYELGQFAEAISSFTKASKLKPDDPDILLNLGLALKQNGMFAEAIESYNHALELSPDDPDILYNLACCLKDQGETIQAIATYERLLQRHPQHKSALNNLAYLHHRQGNYKQAEKAYQQLVTIRPDHAAARYMLAALRGEGETAPPQKYVRDLFDQYSDNFEQSLVQNLDYRVPELLKSVFDCQMQKQQEKRKKYSRCLDLGCGTGLAGEAFRSTCTFLAGVDLSPKMVQRAEQKQLYNELTAGDVVRFLRNNKHQYDLLVAADVITYLGELESLFQAAAGASLLNAVFCFSTEHIDQPEWRLMPTGRYAHSPEYIKGIGQKTGWRIMCSEKARLRKERNEWIAGDLYLMKFQPNA